MHLSCIICIISLSRGGSRAPHHVVAISPHRFLPGNRKPGSESEHQKELIGTVFMSCASNLRLERYFDNVFFENTLFGPFTLKYTFYKNCHFSLSGTVLQTVAATTHCDRYYIVQVPPRIGSLNCCFPVFALTRTRTHLFVMDC